MPTEIGRFIGKIWVTPRTLFSYENLVSTACEFSWKCETLMQEFYKNSTLVDVGYLTLEFPNINAPSLVVTQACGRVSWFHGCINAVSWTVWQVDEMQQRNFLFAKSCSGSWVLHCETCILCWPLRESHRKKVRDTSLYFGPGKPWNFAFFRSWKVVENSVSKFVRTVELILGYLTVCACVWRVHVWDDGRWQGWY